MIVVSRAELDDQKLPKTYPCWSPSELPGIKAILWCPKGHSAILTNHTVDIDGTVHPACICPKNGCGFHDNVRLEDWDPRPSNN